MEVSTARTRLFKVGALVQATHRHIWLRVASHWPGVTGPASHWPGESLARRVTGPASHWPGATLLTRAAKAVASYVTTTLERWLSQNLFAARAEHDACDRSCGSFAPLLLN